MKKNYILILFFAFQSIFSQIINFPDPNFKSFLLSANSGNQVAKDADGNWIKIDTNNDEQIQESEALLVAGLFLQPPPIKDASYINFNSAEGIRSFANLEEINFFMSGLTSLDLKGLIKLKKVTCASGALTSVDLQGLINLNYLDFNNNNLSALELQGLNNVKYINYRRTPLSSLQIVQPVKNSLETLIFTADATTNFSDLEGFNYLAELNFSSQGKQTINFPVLNSLTTLTCYYSLDLVNLNMQGILNLKNLTLSNTGIINLDLHELTALENVDCRYGTITNIKLSSSILQLVCSGNQISSLTLQDSPNLKILDCNNNKLTSLNFQGMTNLDKINCSYNNLASLELQNSFATSLNCDNNVITSLTVRGNTKLSDLYASNNLLTNFNIQDNPKLGTLNISNNLFSSLSFSSLPALRDLYCNDNQLISLNLSGLDNLTNLYCNNNLLTSLDLNPTNQIYRIFCRNNNFISLDLQAASKLISLDIIQNSKLKQLNVKNGIKQQLGFSQCPQLKYICCDETELANFQYLINLYNLQNQCALNTYCSFTPGGIYNTISGTATVDYDNNGCTTADLPFSSMKYSITDGTNSGIILGNANGEYANYLNAGSYTLTPTFENPDYFIASPSNRIFVFADSNNNTQIQDFCITSNGIKNDLEIKIIPVTNARPGFESKYRIFYKNKGNTILSGDFDFNFDTTKTDYISSDIIPAVVTTGNLSWNFNDLKPFESRSINVTFKTKVPPIVNAGDILKFTSHINPVSGEQTPEDNTFILSQTVVGSLDPNDKICLEGEKISQELVGKYVTYKIRFENVGTANAEQVVIKDVIDSSVFDASSIIPITASHSFKTKMTGNEVEFIFENIDLPFDDASNDGYIVFKIKTLPSLTIGSVLKNKADIFFDYNLPITTNLATSQILSTKNVSLKAKIKLYPNPVKDQLNIATTEKLEYLEIYDQVGRILRKINSPTKTIDFSHYEKGNYIIKIKLSGGEYAEKIIKE